MTCETYKNDGIVSQVKANEHYAEALRFLKTRASLDSTLEPYAEFWENPLSASASFYSPEVNKMIDDNYELVKRDGYAELVIPATMYD